MDIEVKTEATCAERREDALTRALNDYCKHKHKCDLEQLDEDARARQLVWLIERQQDKIGFFKTISFAATQGTNGFGRQLRITQNHVLKSFLDMKTTLQMNALDEAFEEGIAEANKEAL